MRKIKLTQSKYALVDNEDYEWLNQWKWFYAGKCGAQRSIYRQNKNQLTVRMHRQIMNNPKGKLIDHINHNPLDNRKSNLRIATRRENIINTPKSGRRKFTSQYKGVWKEPNRWRAAIRVNFKLISLGSFQSERKAALAYNKAAKIHFKQFASLNK